MKFAGLILICASSCLALILPAVGLVKFPIRPTNKHVTASGWNVQALDSSQPVSSNFAQLNSTGSGSTGPGGYPVSNFQPASPSLFSSAANGSASSNTPSTSAGSILSNLMPSGNATSPANGPLIEMSTGMEMPQLNPTQKISMGLWLLLVPVALIGLLMWTVAPDPNAVRRK